MVGQDLPEREEAVMSSLFSHRGGLGRKKAGNPEDGKECGFGEDLTKPVEGEKCGPRGEMDHVRVSRRKNILLTNISE